MSTSHRPLANPDREKDAKELFPFREMSPEEYAARHGIDWACFSYDDYAYEDPELDRWLQQLGRILFTPGRLAEVQEKCLTPEELLRIREREKDPF